MCALYAKQQIIYFYNLFSRLYSVQNSFNCLADQLYET